MSATEQEPAAISPDRIHDDVGGLSWIYEQFGLPDGGPVSQSAFRDALQDATAGLASADEPAWHVWLDETFQSLGFRCRTIQGSIDEVIEMAACGAHCLTRCADGSWLAIGGLKRGRMLLLRPNDENQSTWQTPAAIRVALDLAFPGGALCCVVVEPGLPVALSGDAIRLKPLQRLWGLLRPEWPDIWIVIVFALIIGLLALATPIAVETLVNTVAFGRFLQPVVILSLMLLVVLAFSGALRALQTHLVEIIQRRLFVRVAADIAYRLPRARTDALDGQPGRELVNRFFDVVTVQKVAAQLLLDGVSLILGTVVGMAMLAFYHPWLLGFDVMLLGMLAVIVFVLGRGAVKTSIKESKTKYQMAAWLEDLAGCPTAFRYDGSARFALERADHLIFTYLTARAGHFRIVMRQIVFALGMQALASTVLLGLGGWLVISGQLTLGQLVAAELIVAVIVGSFAKLGKHMESLYDVLASVDKLGALFDLPLERQDGLSSLSGTGDGAVVLRDVACLDSHGQAALSNFDMSIRLGDRIAITQQGDGRHQGDGGASTLLDLLFGLRVPTHGRVTLLGAEIREIRPQALRRHVSLIRDIEVFEGSISDNVRIGRTHVSTADVRRALADIGLLDDLLSLPEQLDTQLVSTGYPLSSTQLRRLMLARACAGAPSLLLIDRVLDGFPDDAARMLLTWLCRPEQPWKLVLITGREDLAALCNRRLQLQPVSPESAGSGGRDNRGVH